MPDGMLAARLLLLLVARRAIISPGRQRNHGRRRVIQMIT